MIELAIVLIVTALVGGGAKILEMSFPVIKNQFVRLALAAIGIGIILGTTNTFETTLVLQLRCELGDCYGLRERGWQYFHEKGEKVPKDEARGVKLLEQAANNGLASAQYDLAWLHLNNKLGANSSTDFACTLLEKAAGQFNQDAINALMSTQSKACSINSR